MNEYENLIAGPFPLQKDTVTIGGNQTLKAGCVLGFKSVSAGAKGKYRFALSSITAAAGTVSVTIGENTFSIDTTAEGSNHTIDEILDSLAALNALLIDHSCVHDMAQFLVCEIITVDNVSAFEIKYWFHSFPPIST